MALSKSWYSHAMEYYALFKKKKSRIKKLYAKMEKISKESEKINAQNSIHMFM